MVLDCQSGVLDHLDSRFVVPLLSLASNPNPARRLNPIVEIEGEKFVMLTQAAAAVRRRELGAVVTSLSERSFEITQALDILVHGV